VPSTALTLSDPVPRLMALPGVHRPQADTLPLAGALAREPLRPGAKVVEIGTGTGAICATAPAPPRLGGVLLMVHSGMRGARQTLELLNRQGMFARFTERASVPRGPVLHARRHWLQKQGVADVRGQLAVRFGAVIPRPDERQGRPTPTERFRGQSVSGVTSGASQDSACDPKPSPGSGTS
jgi:hypothetical protein